MKSNKIIEEELKGTDPDYKTYIKENNEILFRTKDEVLKIVNAFIKSGVSLEKEVWPKLKHRELYLSDDGKTLLE